MAVFRHPPEADKSLRVPCEMRSLFLWGQSAELLVRRTTCTPPRNSLIFPPGRRPYPPACKLYGLEAGPEA